MALLHLLGYLAVDNNIISIHHNINTEAKDVFKMFLIL